MVLLNYFILSIVSFVIIYLTFCESATIRTEKESINGFELSNMTNPQNSNELRTCNHDMPCAWYIYQINQLFGFEKVFKSFLLNKCKCKDDTYHCIRTWEKLSAQAYVYNCRQNATKNDIYAPDHDIFSQNIESANESQFKFFMANQRSSFESRSCGLDMPCGWLEYRLNSFGQKTLKSFLLGRCKCDVTSRCVLSGERLSSQVFVYQCRPNITVDDKFAPDHDIYTPNEDLYKLYRDIIR